MDEWPIDVLGLFVSLKSWYVVDIPIDIWVDFLMNVLLDKVVLF